MPSAILPSSGATRITTATSTTNLGEMGIRSELRTNPAGLVRKALITTAVVGGIIALRRRRRGY